MLVKDFSLKNYFGQIGLFNIFFWKNIFILILMLFLRLLYILSLLLNLLDSLILFEWIFNNLWHHQNTLGSFASTISPFFMMTIPEIKIQDKTFNHPIFPLRFGNYDLLISKLHTSCLSPFGNIKKPKCVETNIAITILNS